MTSMKQILINMVILGVLIFAIMSFIITIQSDSNLDSEERITNNTLINESFGDLETSLDQQESAQRALNASEDNPPQEYIGDLSVGAIISTTRTINSVITGLWNIYIKLPIVILGVSPIVAGAITTILLILIAIGAWAIWKGAIS